MSANFFTSVIHDIQATRYSQLASGTIILYDHLITLDDEIELIWKSSWSWGKVLFIINRYYGLISVIINNYGLFSPLLSDSVRIRFFKWQGWTGLVACMIAEAILQMRLYAMYSLDKKVLAIMVGCFIMASAASAAVMGRVLSQMTAKALPFTPTITFCAPFNISRQFYAFWIPMLAFETLLCGLALYKGYQTFRSKASPFLSGRHFVGILIRDSILYFLVMFATYLTNLLVWITARQTLLEIPIGFSVALSCIMGNRLVLNVREMNTEIQRARTSEQPGSRTHLTGHDSSHIAVRIASGQVSQLSDIEMAQLRSLRSGI